MAKSKGMIDAVAIGLTMELPPDVVRQYASKWTAAKYKGETVDDTGQRWATVAFPIGDKLHRERSDKVVAVAIIKSPDGYAVARLEMPLAVAAQYAVETEDPDPSRGFAIDRAQQMLAEGADPT